MAAVKPEHPEPMMMTLRMLSVIEVEIDSQKRRKMRKRCTQDRSIQQMVALLSVERKTSSLRILASAADLRNRALSTGPTVQLSCGRFRPPTAASRPFQGLGQHIFKQELS